MLRYDTMLDINYIILLFSMITTTLILMGSLVNSFEKYLPVVASQFLRYGKFASKEEPIFKILQVPKSWFKHFYVYSSLLTLAVTFYLVSVFLLKLEVPALVYDALDLIGGSFRQARISNTSAVLALALLTLQSCRRCYDTHFVSIFGKSGRINLAQYLAGYIHYTGSVLSILLETSKLVQNTSRDNDFYLSDLKYMDVFAVILFLWAWVHQYKVTVIFANLRRDKKGKVVTEAHKLPHGDWFTYVSSPHNLAEILMYLALTIILWGSITWLFIFMWVITNQVESSLLAHWWYKENFGDVPKNRKAIIPFIY